MFQEIENINLIFFCILYFLNTKYKKLFLMIYLKLTDACHTKANNRKNTGITGNTSTIGSKGA